MLNKDNNSVKLSELFYCCATLLGFVLDSFSLYCASSAAVIYFSRTVSHSACGKTVQPGPFSNVLTQLCDKLTHHLPHSFSVIYMILWCFCYIRILFCVQFWWGTAAVGEMVCVLGKAISKICADTQHKMTILKYCSSVGVCWSLPPPLSTCCNFWISQDTSHFAEFYNKNSLPMAFWKHSLPHNTQTHTHTHWSSTTQS